MKRFDSFDYHRSNPNVTMDDYIKQLKVSLAEEIEGVIKIYLDTKFWIFLRDVRLEKEENSTLIDLYEFTIVQNKKSEY